jgi:hypothetical protein
MKAHSIYVEEKTVYKCTCKAEFDDIGRAEAHLRHPPQERAKISRPKKRTPLPRREARPLAVTGLEMLESSP